jgi:hypothetical protein
MGYDDKGGCGGCGESGGNGGSKESNGSRCACSGSPDKAGFPADYCRPATLKPARCSPSPGPAGREIQRRNVTTRTSR